MQPGDECPGDDDLAEFLEGHLGGPAQAAIERHLETCESCLGLVAVAVGTDPVIAGSPHDSDELQPGDAIDRYVVGQRLGAGAMGVVFEAFDPELQRRVAIKLVQPGAPAHASERERARMLREAQAMARLHHPGLVPVLAVGMHGDELYLVMELVEGTTMRAWIVAEPRPWKEIVRAYVAAARGLAAAHAAGVVHRDFKPDNVLIATAANAEDVATRVRVIDFGLARLVAHGSDLEPTLDSAPDDLARTAAGAMIGTPAYMPPEQLRDAAVDARADQFALAVSLWEGVYGRRPFSGSSLAAVLESIDAGQITRPPAGTRVPTSLRRTLERALSPRPDARFVDMDAFGDELERCLGRPKSHLALGASLGALGAIAVVAIASRDPSSCRSEAAPGWDEDMRDRIAVAFAGADESLAGAAPAVLATIDRRAAAWHDVQDRICVAEAAGEATSAAQTCLDVRRYELAATLEVIAGGGEDVLARALPMVASLPAIEPCMRAAPQLAKSDPPALVDEARSLREQLARARALGEAGNYEAAEAAVEHVVSRAAEIGHAAVRVEAACELGKVHVDAGQAAEAVPQLEAAFFDAREIGHDEVATQAAITLVDVVGGRLARVDEVGPWVAHAEAALSRWGSSELRAELEKARGGIALRANDASTAIEHYQNSVELLREDGDPDDPRLATAIDALGIAHHIAQHDDIALEHHERALAIRERVYGDEHPHVAHSLVNIARVLMAQGLEEPAIHHNEWVVAINEAALGPEHEFTAVAHNNLGAVWGGLGEPAAAAAEFRAARPGFERLGVDHPDHAMVLANIGQSAYESGDFVEASDSLERALAIRERRFGLDDPATLACAALLGTTSARLGAHRRAVGLIDRALATTEPLPGYAPLDLVRLRMTLVRSRVALDEMHEAAVELAEIRRALATIADPPARLVRDVDDLARAIAAASR
jgi:eukaryotic-like serine/threonine-protein kinase